MAATDERDSPRGAAGSSDACAAGIADAGWRAIIALSLPAMALNIAIPLSDSVITAMLGRQNGHGNLATFAAGASFFGLATLPFSFLTDGVTARCARAASMRDPRLRLSELRITARTALFV